MADKSLPVITGYLAAVEGADTGKPARRQRKPSIGKMIKQAEKAGKNVTSITMPDGVTLTFGQEPTEVGNPWLTAIEKQTQQ